MGTPCLVGVAVGGAGADQAMVAVGEVGRMRARGQVAGVGVGEEGLRPQCQAGVVGEEEGELRP